MHRFYIFEILVIAIMMFCQTAFAQHQEDWIPLFDGGNTEHWRSTDGDYFPMQGWSIEDSILFVNKDNSGHGGSIITRDQYSNFQIEFEFRLAHGANSGIKYLLKQYHDGSWLGCEYQLIDDYGNRDIAGDKDGKRHSASLYELFPPSQSVLKPAGEWNSGKIRVYGKHVEHWLNDVMVVEYTRGDLSFLKAKSRSKFRDVADFGEIGRGHIMLQDHGDEAAFRNIRIRHLPEASEYSKQVYWDEPYFQDFAIMYKNEESVVPNQIVCDRNGGIRVLADEKVLHPAHGSFQDPGILTLDRRYAAMSRKSVKCLEIYGGGVFYLTEEAILNNHAGGKVYVRHDVSAPKNMAVSGQDDFAICDDQMIYSYSSTGMDWKVAHPGTVEILFDGLRRCYWILSSSNLSKIDPDGTVVKKIDGKNLTSMALVGDKIVIGCDEGYFKFDINSEQSSEIVTEVPHPEITAVEDVGGVLWFGSTKGAFREVADGEYCYYAGRRWLLDDEVIEITKGSGSEVLILTKTGLSKIVFKNTTLHEKAMEYEQQVRDRHIRYGLYCDVTAIEDGDLATAELKPHDSDNLWSGMYLGSQLFRYLTSGDLAAKKNCLETFEAMERLHTINSTEGLFGRSYERKGEMQYREEYRKYAEDYWYPGYARSVSWMPADEEWDWRATASSDQTVGQIFALVLVAEFIDVEEYRIRATILLDQLMSYILDNNYQLIDFDEKPTLWGRWNPEFINRFPKMVGDRKLGSSNIIAFLQAAYHFTGKNKYKQAVEDLLYNHGYLENLMLPMSNIGSAPDDADPWSKMLSQNWNHSDDEMYFLAYWSLYHYALSNDLRENYREAIRDHWNIERPERDALWNFSYAVTGASEFDLEESIWHLKEFPLDMIQWQVQNSHRKDIELLPGNFREQLTARVLPPDERPDLKHNRNIFVLDRPDRQSELGAGDTFLLPYWMGRFLGVISGPVR